jgi:hypothetical protein
MEMNFSMFWGLSIMMYESTLIGDQTEYDSLVSKGLLTPTGLGCNADPSVDPLLARGCALYFAPPPIVPIPGVPSGGGCNFCHSGPALSSDQMVGRTDSYGNPLSYGRQLYAYQAGNNDTSKILDPDLLAAIRNNNLLTGVGGAPPGTFVPFGPAPNGNKLEVDGASKVPSLRNVALTPPYFSYGGYANLRQVLKAYNRGLNARVITGVGSDTHGSFCTTGDDSGTGPDGNLAWPIQAQDCGTNIAGILGPLRLLDCDPNGKTNPACATQGKNVNNDDLAALIRFLKSLTDSRVQCDSAPFDHPELTVIVGQKATDKNANGRADDITVDLPAVGWAGYKANSGYCIPNSGDLFAPGMQGRSGGTKAPLN